MRTVDRIEWRFSCVGCRALGRPYWLNLACVARCAMTGPRPPRDRPDRQHTGRLHQLRTHRANGRGHARVFCAVHAVPRNSNPRGARRILGFVTAVARCAPMCVSVTRCRDGVSSRLRLLCATRGSHTFGTKLWSSVPNARRNFRENKPRRGATTYKTRLRFVEF